MVGAAGRHRRGGGGWPDLVRCRWPGAGLKSAQARAAGWRLGVSQVVVQPGETLWGIAVKVDPAADPRAVISEIEELNALSSTAIKVGQVLWVPRA